MTHPPFILPFEALRATDLALVGGKGANLGELARAGLPVPPGFCVTTAAYHRFLEASGQADWLYALLDEIRPDDLERARSLAQQVRARLRQAPMPGDIAQAILEAWRALGPEYAYAVRSSATAEDLPGASFAGQQETMLNIRGEAALLEAVRRVWVSLFTDRALLYRLQQGFDHRQAALAVVVQRMVPAEKSGVLFTADPVSGHRFTMVINASFGLGEAIVSGRVTPDTYRLDKRTGRVVRREIAEKTLAILPRPEGGTREVALPPEQARRPALEEAEIAALADLGRRVEAHYQQPQDIEWAFAAGQLYLLQSRPITTLYPIEGLASPDGSLRIYFSMGHQQGMTRAMSPLSRSIFPILLPLGRTPDGLHNPYLRNAGGRLFVDVTPLLRHALLRRVVFAVLAQFDALAPAMLREAMRRPGFRQARPAHLSWGFVRFAAAMARRVFAALWLRDLTGFVARTNALHDEFVAQVRRRLQAAPSGQARLEEATAILRGLFPFFVHWVPEAAAGMAALRLLPRLARRYLPADQAEALALGIPGNVVNEMNLALDDLAALARQIPSLRDHFTRLGEDAHTWLEQAAALEGTRPFLDALEAFLDRYGARGPGEIDIARPRWREDPAPLLQVLAAHVLGPAHSQRAQWDQMVRQREAAYQALLQTAGRGPFGQVRRWLFRRLYHVATQTGGMREHHKFLAVRVLAEVKEALKATAADLVARGMLRQTEDIWFLTWEELLRLETIPSTPPLLPLVRGGEEGSGLPGACRRAGPPGGEEGIRDALIARRRADMERFQRLTPPLIITSEGETPVVRHPQANLPPGALIGQPVSPGVVEGVARVVRDPQRERLAPGEILVAEFTDPGWTPLFINAGGLVLEVGGSLTHGAVVAREYGIPAVVGVREATKKIHTGQRIRVDGHRGIVEVLPDHAEAGLT